VELFTNWHSWPQAEAGLRERLPADVVATVSTSSRWPPASNGFRYWYASWRAEFADLAAPICDTSSQANRPIGYTK
jgi:hypothetical protein